MKSYEFINESINDKGIFKAMFFGGIPGAGKSYVLNQISSGGIGARVVNTDKFMEFIAKQKNISLSTTANQQVFLDTSKILTINQLVNYINGVLPLFIDGTSSDASNILRRVGILESFGYDVGFVWINTDLETALARVRKRSRAVDEEFIKKVYSLSAGNKKFFKNKFEIFIDINNNDGELSDQIVQKAFNTSTDFFMSPIKNPIGQNLKDKMKERNVSYLSPDIFSKDQIKNILHGWYRNI